MFLAWSALWSVVAAGVLLVLQALGLAPTGFFWVATRVLGACYVGVVVWWMLLWLVDPWTDGALRRLGAQVAEAVQYGLSRGIEASVLVVSVASGVLGTLLGRFDPLLIVFATLSCVASLYAMAFPKRALPAPVLPDLGSAPSPPDPTATPAPREKQFWWAYHTDPIWRNRLTLEAKVLIDPAESQAKRSLERVPDVHRWGHEYVHNGIGPTVASLARALREISEARSMTPLQEAALVLSFAQDAVEYARDQDTTDMPDYPRYPVETIEDGLGDCEDKAILAAAAMRLMGYDAVLLDLPGHVAVGLALERVPTPGAMAVEYSGRAYYYCEATAEGAWIGEAPPDLEGPIEVVPV